MTRFVTAFSLMSMLLGAASAGAQTLSPECQAMMDAGVKQFSVPSHAFITSTGISSALAQSEMIRSGIMVLIAEAEMVSAVPR